MAIKRIASFLVCTLYMTSVFANYVQVPSLKEIEDLKNADEKTLVVFDVDEVLIITEDHFGHPTSDKVFTSIIQKNLSKATTVDQKKDFEDKMSLCTLLPKRALVEKDSPKFIKDLQQRGLKVIALTSCQTGPLGVIPKVERWRIDHLLSLNFNFGSAFPEVERTYLMQIAKEGKTAPLFERGILFSKGYKKGDVLKAFLKQSDFVPSKVIFIDDLVENLDSVKAEIESMNIEFVGYQYTGAKKFFKKANEEVISYQISHLLKTKEWLTDQEVVSVLKSHEKLQETVSFPKTRLAP